MWFIGVEVEQETSAPPPKKNPGSAPALVFKGWQRDVPVTTKLLGALALEREKEGELATTSLEFEFHLQFPCGSPPTELSDFRQSVRSGNERRL